MSETNTTLPATAPVSAPTSAKPAPTGVVHPDLTQQAPVQNPRGSNREARMAEFNKISAQEVAADKLSSGSKIALAAWLIRNADLFPATPDETAAGMAAYTAHMEAVNTAAGEFVIDPTNEKSIKTNASKLGVFLIAGRNEDLAEQKAALVDMVAAECAKYPAGLRPRSYETVLDVIREQNGRNRKNPKEIMSAEVVASFVENKHNAMKEKREADAKAAREAEENARIAAETRAREAAEAEERAKRNEEARERGEDEPAPAGETPAPVAPATPATPPVVGAPVAQATPAAPLPGTAEALSPKERAVNDSRREDGRIKALGTALGNFEKDCPNAAGGMAWGELKKAYDAFVKARGEFWAAEIARVSAPEAAPAQLDAAAAAPAA